MIPFLRGPIAVGDDIRTLNALIDAVNTNAGFSYIDSNTVLTAVPWVAITLPPSYRRFRLHIRNLTLSGTDNVTAAFSFDGGVTYLSDKVNLDAYCETGWESVVDIGTSTLTGGQFGFTDTLIDLGNYSNALPVPASPLFGFDATLDINPGSSSSLTRMMFQVSFAGTAASKKIENSSGMAVVSGPIATVPVTPARATNIIIQSTGDGAAPQTGGANIVTMDYLLLAR